MTWRLDGLPVRSILVSRLRYLGDIAMSTVLLDVLRRGDPGLNIGYLCEASYAPLLRRHPQLNRLHVLASRRVGGDARTRRAVAGEPVDAGLGAAAMIAELRRCRYDLTVDLLFNPRSAWLSFLAGSPVRIGGRRSWRRWLYTHAVLPPRIGEQPEFWRLAPGGLGDSISRLAPLCHGEGENFYDWFCRTYAEELPRPRLRLPPLRAGRAESALGELGIGDRQEFVLLAPGATWPTKEWPFMHWGQLVRLLQERTYLSLAVLSPPARENRYSGLSALMPDGSGGVLPPLPLQDALRVVAAASLVICVDGGIMHAAIAMGRPTLALFGPTAPGIWFPYEQLGPCRVLRFQADCSPCDRHECTDFICLPQVKATEVVEAAIGLLSGGEGTG